MVFFDGIYFGKSERHMILFTVKAWDGPARYSIYGTDSEILNKVSENVFVKEGNAINEVRFEIG